MTLKDSLGYSPAGSITPIGDAAGAAFSLVKMKEVDESCL